MDGNIGGVRIAVGGGTGVPVGSDVGVGWSCANAVPNA